MLKRLCEDGGERSKTCFCQLMPPAAICRLIPPAGYEASASTKAHSNWITFRWKTVSVSYVIELEQLYRASSIDYSLGEWRKVHVHRNTLWRTIGNRFMRADIDTIENRSQKWFLLCVSHRWRRHEKVPETHIRTHCDNKSGQSYGRICIGWIIRFVRMDFEQHNVIKMNVISGSGKFVFIRGAYGIRMTHINNACESEFSHFSPLPFCSHKSIQPPSNVSL